MLVLVFQSLPPEEVGLSPGDYKRVYLATYPRSGNHWMRYLIEEATGVATSSVYCDSDPQHLPTLFPWKGYVCQGGYEGDKRYPNKGEIVVLKTHYPAIVAYDQDNEPPEGKIIRVVRHPIDSIYSYYALFSTDENPSISPIPQEFLLASIESWRAFQEYWNERQNVLTFRYEDLMDNPLGYIRKTLLFIGYKVRDERIRAAIHKYPPNSRVLKHAMHYTEEQLALVASELEPLLKRFNYQMP